jgi:hypothetical protein
VDVHFDLAACSSSLASAAEAPFGSFCEPSAFHLRWCEDERLVVRMVWMDLTRVFVEPLGGPSVVFGQRLGARDPSHERDLFVLLPVGMAFGGRLVLALGAEGGLPTLLSFGP